MLGVKRKQLVSRTNTFDKNFWENVKKSWNAWKVEEEKEELLNYQSRWLSDSSSLLLFNHYSTISSVQEVRTAGRVYHILERYPQEYITCIYLKDIRD